MKVPWLSQSKIENVAADLIDRYQMIVGHKIHPPVPVELLIERALDITLGFEDLREQLGIDDVLGATYVDKRKISIDTSLLPERLEGRLCFTLAHEAGHWVLHRNLVDHDYRTESESRNIFCRKRDARKPIEWQADYFASCLLMPEKEVNRAFEMVYGEKPLMIYNVKSEFCGPISFDPSVETWPMIADKLIDTGGFSNVSKQAMIIRLQKLGLVRNATNVRMTWKASWELA
jgi:Zn-dependent peptidase ImmA (M78 family)